MGFFRRNDDTELVEARAELAATVNQLEVTTESFADLEQLTREDRGWLALTTQAASEFTRDGIARNALICRTLAVKNPLMKRGLALRQAYLFGRGVPSIGARDQAATDVNDVIQAHVDRNTAVLFGAQALTEKELAHGTDGNVFLAHFTNPRTGRVLVRSISLDEIVERITDPEDDATTWFWRRRWTETTLAAENGATVTTTAQREALYPDIDHRPRIRPRSIDSVEVVWDAPILASQVNKLDGWDFGLGDSYAAIDFARAYNGFLGDWAKLVKSLSRIAWRVSGQNKATSKAAAAAIRNTNASGDNGPVGGVANMAGATLEAVPKSGATIDSDSGRPLAAMAAAALGVPVTMLLADPGVTGSRATAETLDKPTVLELQARQRHIAGVLTRSCEYAIDQAAKAPQGALRGTVGRDDDGREVITLAGDVDRTVECTFPALEDIDPKAMLDAIQVADQILDGKAMTTVVRAVLQAMPFVEDVDAVMDEITDEDGNLIDPTMSAGQAAIDAANRGQGPGVTPPAPTGNEDDEEA